MKNAKKTRNRKKKKEKQEDLTMFSAAIYPEEQKAVDLNTDFLFEELKKRRPDKTKIKELISTPEQCRIPPPHTPKYLKTPLSANTSNQKLIINDPNITTRAISSRTTNTRDSIQMLSVSCFGSPNVVQFQMRPRSIPNTKRAKTAYSSRRRNDFDKKQNNGLKCRSVPQKTYLNHETDEKTYSWKYMGDANDSLGTFTARIPYSANTETATRAQSAINSVRRIKVKEKKKVVHPRDLYTLSINQENEYVKTRNYQLDYDTEIDENAIAGEDIQTFLVVDDKLVPLKASILQ